MLKYIVKCSQIKGIEISDWGGETESKFGKLQKNGCARVSLQGIEVLLRILCVFGQLEVHWDSVFAENGREHR